MLLPCAALAAGLPAGFAPTSFFASKTNSTAGDTISLFSVLYNESTATISGDVVFTVDGTSIGTKPFSLSAGETQTPSISWTAVEGTHSASAYLENVAGGSASDLNDKTDSITLTVAPAPPPSAASQAVTNITNIINSGTQSAAPAAQNALGALEQVRQGAIQTLTQQLATPPAEPGKVLGTSTSNVSTSSTSLSGMIGPIWRAILGALLYVCQVQVFFYLALLIVLYIIYKIIRAIFSERRPRY
jgi:hypothetical protein